MHHTSTILSHPAIEVRALSTLSPTQAVLRQVSFSVDRGTVALLTGPDTAAHTTLLQLLAGRLSPTGGRVRMCGLDVRTARLAASGRTGYLPAQTPDCGHMRVADILGFAFKARGLSADTDESRLSHTIGRCHLHDRLDVPWSSLDQGLQRQVTLALVLLHGPDVLLLDRTLDGLDTRARARLMDVVEGLRTTHTLLIATSSAPIDSLRCDQVLYLEDGHLRYDGPAAGLSMSAPA